MHYKKYFFIGFLWLMGWQPAAAQLYPAQYRPPNLNWQQLSTSHFKILFPDGEDSVAFKTAHILEKEYPKVQQLTGGQLSYFPVILSNYNDRSNGLVTSLHFRSEIDISPIKGKELNPQTGGWLENVVPHELTHAVQFSHLGGFGLGQIVNIFSPDLARSMHGATPAGIQEGLAVYFESNGVAPGGGRGHYSFFTNQFNAVFDSPDRWSMGQIVQVSAYSRPFSRHYIGGYEFTQWLQDTYGPATSRDAIDFNIRWPFFGYGLALKHATGKFPSQLYDEFEHKKEDKPGPKSTEYSPLPIELDGAEIRRPKWLSDSTLVFYGSFYNAASGFYRYDLNTHTLQRKITTSTVSDYNYSLTQKRDSLIYSFNQADALYPNAFKSALVATPLTGGSVKILDNQNRLYAPAISVNSTYVLQVDHSQETLVKIDKKTNQLVKLFGDPDYTLVSVGVDSQNPDSLAIVMNHHGNQALWLTSKSSLKNDLENPPSISFSNGSIFDPVWHPDGNRLLFSADFTGTFQVYEYNVDTGSITQITHAPYNAFEASYSPHGNRVAFIIQQRNERLPVVLLRNNFYGKKVDSTQFNANTSAEPPGLIVDATMDSSWQQSDYKTGLSWLKPRTVLPVMEQISGSDDQYKIGAGLYSSDLLQQQSYSLELTTTQERLWYDLTYQNKQFFPGFKTQIFSRPSFQSYRFVTQNKNTVAQTFLRQERSFALSVPMQFTLKQNVDYTSFYLEPEIRQSQIRYFNQKGNSSSDFSNTTIGNIFGQFNYNLRQNIRDVQPNSGLLLYSELEHYFGSGGLTLQTTYGKVKLKSNRPTAIRAGIYGYFSPLKRWNQSLRIGLQGITQTAPVFDNQSIVSNGFADNAFPYSNNLVSLNGRYTIPLIYPDNGGLLVPLYLSSVYIAAFSNTVFDPVHSEISSSQTVVGGGLRVQFRISNLSFDIGAGVALEPSRSKIHYFIGDF